MHRLAKNRSIFVLGTRLFAGAGQSVHGGAAAGPVFQDTVLYQLIDRFFGDSGLFIKNFGQVVEIKFGLGFQLFGQLGND